MSAIAPAMVIRDVLYHVARELAAAGLDEPKREARLLVSAALDIDLAGLIGAEHRPVGAGAARLATFLARRAAREPLSRILGRREFHGLDLVLNPATLDPRQDTETLVDAVLAFLHGEGRADAPLRILDLGTGSGAILLALLHRLPGATGIGVDIAPEALCAARANANAHGLAGRAGFVAGDLFEGLAGPFEVIVSNPPYIPSARIGGLDPEVRLFDPVRALDGGIDGLDFYRRIVSEAPPHLVPGGLLAVEIGLGQADRVARLFSAHGFDEVHRFHDLGGIERVLAARWPGP